MKQNEGNRNFMERNNFDEYAVNNIYLVDGLIYILKLLK